MVTIIDDLLVYPPLEDDHKQLLRMVSDKLQEPQLYAKLKKCEFWLSKVGFLGHVINQHGISVGPSKISTIVN